MALFIRFFVVIFAFLLASFAAGAVLVLGAIAPGAPDVATQQSDWLVVWFLIVTTSVFVFGFAFLPALIVILLAESFTWRSVVLYALAGGAIGLFCGYTLGFVEWAPDFRFDNPLGTNFELFAAAGIAAGLVYWILAGRTAGNWRRSSSQDVTPS